MNAPARYRDPLLLDRLAADYLTGGMSAAAARRARALMEESPEFRAAVARWRQRLDAGLLAAQRIGAPSDTVWAGVRERIATGQVAPAQPPAGSGWGLRAWRRLTAALGAVAVAAVAWAVVLTVRGPAPAPTAPAQAQMVAMLQSKDGAAGAVLMVQPGGRFTFTALAGVQPPPGRSFELWLLPKQGAPISLGVAQPGRAVYTLPAAAQAALAQAKGFAVSVEPPGGSPTGQPTGPVVLVGDARAA